MTTMTELGGISLKRPHRTRSLGKIFNKKLEEVREE